MLGNFLCPFLSSIKVQITRCAGYFSLSISVQYRDTTRCAGTFLCPFLSSIMIQTTKKLEGSELIITNRGDYVAVERCHMNTAKLPAVPLTYHGSKYKVHNSITGTFLIMTGVLVHP